MSETSAAPKKKIIGHRVVVAGVYLSNIVNTPGHTGEGRRNKGRLSYSETFDVPLNHGAPLTYVLASLLGPRLREKDKHFRAVVTHELVGKPVDILE